MLETADSERVRQGAVSREALSKVGHTDQQTATTRWARALLGKGHLALAGARGPGAQLLKRSQCPRGMFGRGGTSRTRSEFGVAGVCRGGASKRGGVSRRALRAVSERGHYPGRWVVGQPMLVTQGLEVCVGGGFSAVTGPEVSFPHVVLGSPAHLSCPSVGMSLLRNTLQWAANKECFRFQTSF